MTQFKKGDYLTCNGCGLRKNTGVIIQLNSDLFGMYADITCIKEGIYMLRKNRTIKGYRIINGGVEFRLATDAELIEAGIMHKIEEDEKIPSSQIQFQSKTCGGTTYMQRMMHRIIELRKHHKKTRLTVMVMQGEMQQEVVNRVKKDVALLRKYTGSSSFITVRKEK